MITTIDKAGRIVVPIELRRRLGLEAGSEIEIRAEEGGLRIERHVSPPEIVERAGRRVVRPRVAKDDLPEVDVASWIEEERSRWPG